jgi:hypothetical protein
MVPSTISPKGPVRTNAFRPAGVSEEVPGPQQKRASRITTGTRILISLYSTRLDSPNAP